MLLQVSLFFGLSASFNLGLKQLQNIMFDDRMNNGTLVRRLGFDRSKILLSSEMIVLVSLYSLACMRLEISYGFMLLSTASFLVFAFYMINKILKLQSPLSSEIVNLRNLGNLIPFVGSILMIFSIYLQTV